MTDDDRPETPPEDRPDTTPEERPETPLARVMQALNLKRNDVVRAARKIAHEFDIRPISRRQLGRFLSGENKPTEEKIFLVTSAIQDLTGEPLNAADLFQIQRTGVAQSAPVSLPSQVRRAAHDRNLSVAVFSLGGALPRIWRVLVIEAAAALPATDAFEQLYTEYFVLLHAIATHGYRVPEAAAEELVHDTFMAFLERHTTIQNVKGWLLATVRNQCLYWRRDHQRETPLAPGDYQTADERAQGDIEYCIRRLTAAAVLAQLGDKCRETLLGFIADESIEQIAARLLITRAYAERLISRCRDRAVAKYRAMRRPSSI